METMAPHTFTVADMTCGHCVRSITAAVETALPGARVTADVVTRQVTVDFGGDAVAVAAVIQQAGYTPVAV